MDGDLLTFAIVSQPIHGTLSGSWCQSHLQPRLPNFNGTDSFTFTVNDGQATSAPATVSITVTAVNDPPVANPASVSAITGAANARDVVGQRCRRRRVDLRHRHVAQPTERCTGTGPTFTYTSVANFAGSDSFTFAVSDGQSQSAGGHCLHHRHRARRWDSPCR